MDDTASAPPPPIPSRILVLDGDQNTAVVASKELAAALPAAEVVSTWTIERYQEELDSGEFDIVVLDYDIPTVQGLDFIPRLQLRDYAPEILLVSRCDQVATVRRIAETRRRYIVRDEQWMNSVAHSVRDMLRIRRLEHDNAAIRARLLEANGLLEEKNRRLDEFCATVAHDIRGPLAGLILKIDYILETHESEFEPRCAELLKRSLGSANRLVSIVQAMYEFAKVGSKSPKMELVDLKRLVQEVVADLHVDNSQEIEIGIDDLPTVWANPDLMRRVFINLISNAIKYSDKPQVRLNVGYEGDAKRTVAEFARIYVEDNGPGIPDDEVRGVFKMFSRGRSGSSKGSDGMGIGLAVVQKIIELHSGKIEVNSTIGKGCKFTFSLPREPVQIGG